MVDNMLTLDKQQLARIAQIVLDEDEKEALNFLTEINKKFNTSQVCCDPLGQKMREGIDTAISKYKKKQV